VLESEFDIPNTRFRHKFSELTEPSSYPDGVAIPLLERKEDSLSH